MSSLNIFLFQNNILFFKLEMEDFTLFHSLIEWFSEINKNEIITLLNSDDLKDGLIITSFLNKM